MRDDLELLGERIAEHSTHIDAAMHRLLTDIRAFDEGGGWYAQGAKTCAHWLSWRVGWGLGTAREHVRVATRLGELPVLDDALRRGLISYSKIRAMTRVATPANEALLLEEAHFTTAAQLEQICRKYALVQRAPTSANDARDRRHVSRRDTEDGMVVIEATLHADEASIVWSALTRVAKEAMSADVPAGTRTLDRATALVTAAQDILRGTSKERAPVDVVITVSKSALEHRAPSPLETIAVMGDGACLSVDAARRHCCDAGIVEIIEDDDGTPLSVGRKTRSMPAPIKRAMIKRDGGCRFPGCTHKLFVEGHHVVHWIDGGETSLENALSLCSYHHRFVHEYGFYIAPTSEGPLFFDADDRVVLAVPPMRTPAVVGLPALIAAHQQLQLTPETAACGWDGRPIDYSAAVDELLRADAVP